MSQCYIMTIVDLSRRSAMTCRKCKGLMIQERQPAVSSSAVVLRCLNCGLIIDPLIEQNRSNHIRAKAA
jgi:RNase P subunit RPR2